MELFVELILVFMVLVVRLEVKHPKYRNVLKGCKNVSIDLYDSLSCEWRTLNSVAIRIDNCIID